MHGVITVIGKCLHEIKNDPENNEDRQRQYQLTRWFTEIIAAIEYKYQYDLFDLKTYQDTCQCDIPKRDRTDKQYIFTFQPIEFEL